MDDPAFLFPHQVPKYLRIARSDFDLLRKYDSFPKAERLKGTCVFFYWADDCRHFVQSFQTRKSFQDHLDYLNCIDRED